MVVLLFSFFGSYSEYQFHQKLQTRTVSLYGDTTQVGIRGDYAFSRSQNKLIP